MYLTLVLFPVFLSLFLFCLLFHFHVIISKHRFEDWSKQWQQLKILQSDLQSNIQQI